MSPRIYPNNLPLGEGEETETSAYPTIVLRLYIAGRAPNSAQAIDNITAICEEHMQYHVNLEIVDILEDPLRALTDAVLVTPTLIKIAPLPKNKIIGNLGEKDRVLTMLGIRGATK